MSMFKVGQEVVCIDAKHSNHLSNGEIYKVVYVCYGGTHLIVNRDGYTGEESTYSVNRFEIAVGHRIESSNSQAISDCSLSNLCQNDTQNSLSIKQENQDVGDDTHIENHVSPNCKVGVK